MEVNAITPESFAAEMRKLAERGNDPEYDHKIADALLCRVLDSLGYGEGAAIYEGMQKWYRD